MQKTTQKGPTNRQMWVMLIEDSAVDKRIVQNALAEFEGKILLTCLPSVAEARQILVEETNKTPKEYPHLIITDYFMGMDSGYDFLREIKEHESLKAIPIVILSVSDDEELIKEAYGLGASGWVIKDMEIYKNLRTVISYWLHASRTPGI